MMCGVNFAWPFLSLDFGHSVCGVHDNVCVIIMMFGTTTKNNDGWLRFEIFVHCLKISRLSLTLTKYVGMLLFATCGATNNKVRRSIEQEVEKDSFLLEKREVQKKRFWIEKRCHPRLRTVWSRSVVDWASWVWNVTCSHSQKHGQIDILVWIRDWYVFRKKKNYVAT